MATKQELVAGLEFVISEGKRIGASLDEAGWSKVQDLDGWKNTQVLAHVASVGTIVVPFVTNVANSAPGSDPGAGVDIDSLNAQLVGARAGKSVADLVDEITSAYTGVIEFVQTQSDDFLAQKRTFRGYVDVPLSDVMYRMVVLHGIAHIYSAYAATM
jgi:hypothetical protein